MGRIFLDAEFSAVSKSMGRPLIQAELLGLLNSENGLCDILCGLGPGGELAEFLPSAAAAKALTAVVQARTPAATQHANLTRIPSHSTEFPL